MHQLSRRILSFGCLVLMLLGWSDWGGPWRGALAFALGVGAVVFGLYERRLRKTDEFITLDLQR